MEEIYLDIWFYDLPSDWQEDISHIKKSDYGITDDIEGTEECDQYYEYYDNAVSYWWDSLSYETKLAIYEKENQ